MAFSLKCRQLHPDPYLGPLKHDHSLTLIFFTEGDLQNRWIKRGDPTVIWPRDWLPKEEGLRDNILVLSVECHVEPKPAVSVPLERILVRDLVMNTKWELDRAQTIVLVGHGLGGLVIKSLPKSLHLLDNLQGKRCKAFKQNIKGIVFYSVPHTTSEEEFVHYCKSYTTRIQYLDQDFTHFKRDMVLLNVEFEKSNEQHIKLFAFVEGQKVMVPQSSTYKLVQNNVWEIEDANHFQVSQPLDQQHASYKRLLQLIQEDLAPFLKLDVMIKTIEDSMQTQKLDVMINTIEHFHIKSPKDLQSLSLALKEILGKTSILCVGGKAKEGDSVEFLFMHAGDMAKVVGVGLDWAKVVVTKEFCVKVMQEDEGEWTKLWCLEHFVPRIITICNPKQELMTHPNSAKTDGVELEANLGCVYVEDGEEENAHACCPLVFELVEYIGLKRENAMKMKEVSREKSSGSTKGRKVSGAESSGPTEGREASGVKSSGSTKDGEVSREKSNQSTSSGSRQESRRNENDEGSPNSLNPSLSVVPQDEDERTLTVNVFPKSKQFTFPLWGPASPSCISPKLVFKFQKRGGWRMIMSETETSCSFGEMENEDTKNGFGFYQDKITISLKCNDEDHDAARVSQPSVKDVKSVNIPGGTNFTQGSNHDVPFVQLNCYHVNDQGSPKNLTYKFQCPQHILQQFASSDSSDFKTENTFRATIVGNWEGLNYKMSPYVFSVNGHIISKKYLRQSIEYSRPTGHFNEYPLTGHFNKYPLTGDFNKYKYAVALKVNHAMTHMPHKVNTVTLSESNNILKEEDVMEMEPATPI